jgi:hypothetical protein
MLNNYIMNNEKVCEVIINILNNLQIYKKSHIHLIS